MVRSVPTRLVSRLKGKVMLVTGGSRGIGREVARALCAAGARVVVNGRDAQRVHATVDRLSADYPTAEVVAGVADVATEGGARHLVDLARERWGRIDGVIANAGVSMRGPVRELRETALDRLVRGNLYSAVLPVVAALPELEACGGGVVFVSTVAAIRGFPGVSLYSATKAAVESFAQSLEAEVAATGVSVGVVFLGFVENDPEKQTLGPDGTPFHHHRRASLTQREAANAIVIAAARQRRRTITIGAGRLLDIAHRLLPRLTARVIAAGGGRIHQVTRDE